MDEKKQEMLEKIRKAVALSLDEGATEEERDNASRFAERLMSKYKISMAQIQREQTQQNDPLASTDMDSAEMMYGGHNKRSHWESYLASRIADTFECECILYPKFDGYIEGRYRYKTDIVFIGMEDDVESCLWFFDSIQMAMGAKIEALKGANFTQKESYALGMLATVSDRLKEMYKRVEETLPTNVRALVVVKKDLAERRLRKEFPHVVTSNHKNHMKDANYFMKGVRDGNNISLASGREQVRG